MTTPPTQCRPFALAAGTCLLTFISIVLAGFFAGLADYYHQIEPATKTSSIAYSVCVSLTACSIIMAVILILSFIWLLGECFGNLNDDYA